MENARTITKVYIIIKDKVTLTKIPNLSKISLKNHKILTEVFILNGIN